MNRFTFWAITKMMSLSHRILYQYNDDYKKWRNSEFIKTKDEIRKRIAGAHGVTSTKMHIYPSLYNSDIPKDKIINYVPHGTLSNFIDLSFNEEDYIDGPLIKDEEGNDIEPFRILKKEEDK